ncbi:prepilin-type N-terminal cleavage/methylation domain-containing protein [Glaciecola sp. MF2-115]|uniref:prepilin-type N-terminal cleavage/methylation domain-containing protein n=1 Tax=Glaciecola sp. MF2-115 TaxID=3384827 RepID=UPI00399F2287
MKNQMNKQKGFTLIELIIVIVILGILAVTAAPRFIDLQSDARAKTLQGVKAALQGASQLVYAKAAIAGVQNSSTAVDVTVSTGNTVSTINGYPNALVIEDVADVATFLDLSTGDFDVINASTPVDNFIITFSGQVEAGNCFIRYTNAAANAAPAITTVETGC